MIGWIGRVMRVGLSPAFAALLPAWSALADCEDGVAALTAHLAAVTDPHVRDVLTADLRQAQLDLWEFDEVECAVALGHAARFLRRQPDMAAAPDPGQPGVPAVRRSP